MKMTKKTYFCGMPRDKPRWSFAANR